jgi:hypothetical protein
LPRRGLLGNLASGIELRLRTLLTKNVADIELTQVQVIGIVLPLGLRGLDESNIPTSGPTGTPSRDRRYGAFE